jgi:hypothetical protein
MKGESGLPASSEPNVAVPDWFSAAGGKVMAKVSAAVGTVLVALFVLGHVSPLANQVTFDESNLVYDASRLLAGQVIYRDFFCFLPPGGMYLMSGWPAGWWGRPETGTRYLTAISVFAIWLLAWRCLRKVSVAPDFPSGPMAALFPLCVFPYAANAPHHWMAVAWYVGSIAVVFKVSFFQGSWRWWSLGGALAGTSACFLQTEGVLALALLASGLLLSKGRGRDLLARVAASAAGLLVAILVWVGPLLIWGAVRPFVKDAIIWSAMNYRHPGSINYRPFLVDLPDRYAGLWRFDQVGPGVPGALRAVSGSILYAVLLGLVALCLFLSCRALIGILRDRKLLAGPVVLASVQTLLGLGVFYYSGPGWIHLVYVVPPILLLWGLVLAHGLTSPRELTWLRKGILGAACLGLCCHGPLLLTHVPRAWEYVDVDRVDRESPLNQSLRGSPLLKSGDSIVVLPTGGNVYLYTYPAAIGYTYLFPLEDGYHSLEDHTRAAAEIEKKKPKLILIHRVRLKAFLGDGGPLALVIRRDYSPGSGSPAVALFARNGA